MKLGPILPDSHECFIYLILLKKNIGPIKKKKLQKKEIKFTSVWTMDYPRHQGIYGHKE